MDIASRDVGDLQGWIRDDCQEATAADPELAEIHRVIQSLQENLENKQQLLP